MLAFLKLRHVRTQISRGKKRSKFSGVEYRRGIERESKWKNQNGKIKMEKSKYNNSWSAGMIPEMIEHLIKENNITMANQS